MIRPSIRALCLMSSLFQPWCKWHRLARHGSGQPESQATSSPITVQCIRTATSARHRRSRRGWLVLRASAMPVELLDLSDGLVQYEEVRSSRR